MAEGWGLPQRERTRDHNRINNPLLLPPERCTAPVCRYYPRGACAYAEKCRFLHLKPPDSAQQNRAIHHSKAGMGEIAALNKHKVKSPIALPTVQEEKKVEKSCSAEDWVNAPEFHPSADFGSSRSPKTYAQAVSSLNKEPVEAEVTAELCPYNKQLEDCKCPFCPFSHRLLCDICNLFCLDASDENERKKHLRECVKKHERDMEISFAIQRSKDKTCGICFDVIMEKDQWDQKFGILPNCNHCFCLTCIRKWRQAKNFGSRIIRACPECRVFSEFVCPSSYWVDSKEDKDKLILDYKDALSLKDCKYFLQGRGKCPFGNKCFYLHAYPDGTKADVGPPVRQRRQNADGEVEVLQHIFLWDYIEERDDQWQYSIEELDDIFAFFSESDDSDWSDYDYLL